MTTSRERTASCNRLSANTLCLNPTNSFKPANLCAELVRSMSFLPIAKTPLMSKPTADLFGCGGKSCTCRSPVASLAAWEGKARRPVDASCNNIVNGKATSQERASESMMSAFSLAGYSPIRSALLAACQSTHQAPPDTCRLGDNRAGRQWGQRSHCPPPESSWARGREALGPRGHLGRTWNLE